MINCGWLCRRVSHYSTMAKFEWWRRCSLASICRFLFGNLFVELSLSPNCLRTRLITPNWVWNVVCCSTVIFFFFGNKNILRKTFSHRFSRSNGPFFCFLSLLASLGFFFFLFRFLLLFTFCHNQCRVYIILLIFAFCLMMSSCCCLLLLLLLLLRLPFLSPASYLHLMS